MATRREVVGMMAAALVGSRSAAGSGAWELGELERMASEVSLGSRVAPGAEIPGVGPNETGYALRVPGATLTFYPAFWVRDAAMMLGAGLVPTQEVAGWVRVVASTQAGPEGIRLANGLSIPPYSIPDHITLHGSPCWYPGAYDGPNQGDGTFGFLPPADDAFFFIGMVREHLRLTGRPTLFRGPVRTPWGEATVAEVCEHAFDSVAADPQTGLVTCEAGRGRTRVDWGFCDTVRKTGLCLMPSLLRWRAARDLVALHRAAGSAARSAGYSREASRVREAIPRTFYQSVGTAPGGEGLLLSATGVGRKDDVWASAFAVTLGVLPRDVERAVTKHLLTLYRAGGTVLEGQVRHLPPTGSLGGYWEDCRAARDTYQNGAYWGTPTGWFVSALGRVDRAAAAQMLRDYLTHLKAKRAEGAPWECINPSKAHYQNPRYSASVCLPLAALKG
ncbi:MAG TPA: hypothetical protein VGN26_22905 [Armatimonadota bacterium]